MLTEPQPPAKPQFVVLHHQFPFGHQRETHWDLMLEHEEQLLTWALPTLPREEPISCSQLAPHRIAYLDYEGPVSGNRGHVTRWDRGTFRWMARTPELWIAEVAGERLNGTLRLAQGHGGWVVSMTEA